MILQFVCLKKLLANLHTIQVSMYLFLLCTAFFFYSQALPLIAELKHLDWNHYSDEVMIVIFLILIVFD